MEASPCPLVTPMVDFQLDLLGRTRRRMLELVDGLSTEQLLHVPAGFHNNLLWQLGHVAVAAQALCYERSGLPPRLPVWFKPLFGKGSSPAQWTGRIDPDEVRAWMLESLDMLRRDFEAHAFTEYTPYETSTGSRITRIGEALDYVLWHEGVHLGNMMALRKLV